MQSPRFSLNSSDIPSLYKSAAISMFAVLFGLFFLFIVKMFLPNQDFSIYEAAIATAIGGWIVNLIKEFMEGK